MAVGAALEHVSGREERKVRIRSKESARIHPWPGQAVSAALEQVSGKEHVLRSHPKFMDLGGYLASAHFNTDARRMLFDSYAEHVLLPAGVLLWDVYGVTSIGDNKPHDMVGASGA